MDPRYHFQPALVGSNLADVIADASRERGSPGRKVLRRLEIGPARVAGAPRS